MNFFKSHFEHNKKQRNGIFFLVVIILLIQIIYFNVDFSNNKIENNYTTEIAAFQKEYDSLKATATKEEIIQFNPNFTTDFKGYQLGMSVQEIDKLLKFRETGKYINSAKEFQKVTGVSDSLLKKLTPMFKFPDWTQKKKEYSKKAKNNKIVEILDINSATKQDFVKVHGIGDKLATRIINYRTKLQGFTFNNQLYEVWGIKSEVVDEVLTKFEVKEKPVIQKININTATFKEVLSIVYLDYELTKKIFNYRDEVAEIQSIEELKKIDDFPLNKFNRIALYLEAK